MSDRAERRFKNPDDGSIVTVGVGEGGRPFVRRWRAYEDETEVAILSSGMFRDGGTRTLLLNTYPRVELQLRNRISGNHEGGRDRRVFWGHVELEEIT